MFLCVIWTCSQRHGQSIEGDATALSRTSPVQQYGFHGGLSLKSRCACFSRDIARLAEPGIKMAAERPLRRRVICVLDSISQFVGGFPH